MIFILHANGLLHIGIISNTLRFCEKRYQRQGCCNFISNGSKSNYISEEKNLLKQTFDKKLFTIDAISTITHKTASF